MSGSESQPSSLYGKLISHSFVVAILRATTNLYKVLTPDLMLAFHQAGSTELQIQILQQKLQEIDIEPIGFLAEFRYHNEVFEHATNLTSAIERIEMVPIYLRRFPKSPTYEKNRINLHSWLHYHYSNYLVTVISIYDTALLLTNAVFSLGIEHRFCNTKKVTNNSRIKNTSTEQALIQLDKVTKEFREPRNLFVHRNKYPDLEFLDELERARSLDDATQSLDIPHTPRIHSSIVAILYKNERRKLIQGIRSKNIQIADAMQELFTSLDPMYSTFSNTYKKVNSKE